METAPGLSGLAVSTQFDQRINDQQNLAEYDRRLRSEAIARATMNAEQMKYQHASNPFDEALLRKDAEKVFKEVGSFRQQNPDWEWNTNKRAWIDNKIDSELRNNPHLIRSLQYSQALKEYQADMAEAQKNPGQWDEEKLNEQKQHLDNYVKTGHWNGMTGLADDNKYAAPVYSRPAAIVDLPTVLPKMGNTIKDYNIVTTQNGGWYNEVKPEQSKALKDAAYAQYNRSIQVMAKRLGFTTQEQVDKWVQNNIEAGFDKSHNLGDPFALRKLQIAEGHLGVARAGLKLKQDKENAKGGSPYLTWDDAMSPKRASTEISPEVFNKVWGSKQNVVIKGLGGQAADLKGYDFNSDGFIVKPQSGKYKGLPYATGYIDVPVKVAQDAGLVKDKNLYFNADDPDEWKVGDGFDSNRISVKRAVDKDGKSQLFVRVLHEIPLDPTNQSARSMYQAATSTPNKFRGQAQNVFGKQPPNEAMVDDEGNVFDSAGNYLGASSDFE